ncbi:MAG: hypothetical protein ACP5DX_12970 [Paracoccaceae bacterium]|jgi:hypothetical protein
MYDEYARQLEKKRIAKFAERILLSVIVLVLLLITTGSLGATISDKLLMQGSAALAQLAAPAP